MVSESLRTECLHTAYTLDCEFVLRVYMVHIYDKLYGTHGSSHARKWSETVALLRKRCSIDQ